jgi:hypothetical protein
MTGPEEFTSGLTQIRLTWEVRGKLVLVGMDVAPQGWACPFTIGTDPPADFPRTPPHWLHLPKALSLPDESGRLSELGPEWRKWSRSCPGWVDATPNPIGQWAAQVRSLILAARSG